MEASVNELGYEDERFEIAVSQNFHCPICSNVLKDPVLCRRNQHHFCTGCITRHLRRSQTCPSCMEELTLETLSPAPRVLTRCLCELKIRCDYFGRGCGEFIQLGNLRSHTVNCRFSPVICSNEGCAMEINKQDRVYHETEVCELRKVKCHDCVQVRKELGDVKANQADFKGNLAELKRNQEEFEGSQAELKGNQAELKENLAEMKANQIAMKDELQKIRCIQDEMVKKMETMVLEVKNEVLKCMKKVVQQPVQHQCDQKKDIIIAGGMSSSGDRVKSVEMFSWAQQSWMPLKPMNNHRCHSSSFVYKNQIVVAGGKMSVPAVTTNTVEAMTIGQEQGEWFDFPARLPVKLYQHKNVVYKDRLIVVGGRGKGPFEYSDAIYEVLLVPPYSAKLLHKIPQPVAYHGVQLYKNSIFILGGFNEKNTKGLSRIIKYDINKNKCREVARLPFPVNEMATACWGSYLIVLGGLNELSQVLDTVILYDIEKNETRSLPSMIHKRKGSTAVVTGGCMVIMGGTNEIGEVLKSVECFSFYHNTWKELPPMNETRAYATAVVKPDA